MSCGYPHMGDRRKQSMRNQGGTPNALLFSAGIGAFPECHWVPIAAAGRFSRDRPRGHRKDMECVRGCGGYLMGGLQDIPPGFPPPPVARTGWPWSQAYQGDNGPDDSCEWPRVTIVTPSWNQGRFLEETIRSVLLQGYPNLDYLVIDGGSIDGSVEIIRKYEPWLSFWTSEKDNGQGDA